MRIFPFTLRIVQYSRAPASWPGRPKIHFEGEMYYGATPTQATTVGGAPNPDLRRMQGTVQMTASGEVCWSLVRFLSYPTTSPLLSLSQFVFWIKKIDFERESWGCCAQH